MSAKIEQIEERVKLLHLNPVQQSHSVSKKNVQIVFSEFWFVHVKPVIEISKKLAVKYKANVEILWLSAILHDIARLDDMEPHDEIGANKAMSLLLTEEFTDEFCQDVSSVILTHRCKKFPPMSIEQKILATADAMAHFTTPFYLWYSSISSDSFSEQLLSGLKKIRRDFHEKIFFDEERESVKKQYELLKDWFAQEIK